MSSLRKSYTTSKVSYMFIKSLIKNKLWYIRIGSDWIFAFCLHAFQIINRSSCSLMCHKYILFQIRYTPAYNNAVLTHRWNLIYINHNLCILQGETMKDSKEWLRLLRYHAKDLGSWRRRRNALANIMINGMIRP